jgi:hypothetical protein
MQDDPPYYSPSGFVYVGEHALELGAVWDGVEAAERAGVTLDQIGLALTHNWTAAAVALARRNVATLRALIREAGS